MFGWRLFWHLTCIRVSLLQTHACNIISHSIFTGISLQPPHYSIQRGFGGVSFPQWPTVLRWTPTALQSQQQHIHLWCCTETNLVVFRAFGENSNLTMFPQDSISRSNRTTPAVCAANYYSSGSPTDLNINIHVNGIEKKNWSGFRCLFVWHQEKNILLEWCFGILHIVIVIAT